MVMQILLEILIVLIGVSGMLMHSGWLKGEIRHDFFRYYTNLSNLLVVMFYLIRLVVRVLGTYNGFFGSIVFSELWFFTVTMSIFLTFGIYHFVLTPHLRKAPSGSPEFKLFHSFSNYCVHYIVPLLSLLNWLIFADKGQLRYSWSLIWTIIPWLYVFFALIMGARGKIIEYTDSAYPYDFMDVAKHGKWVVARNCLLVGVVFSFIGLVFVFLRRLI